MHTTRMHFGISRILYTRTFRSQPALRTGILKQKSSQRLFHATHRHQFQSLDICLSETHNLLASLHTVTGLPWVLTLPLTALLIRGVLITPLMIYNIKNRERMASISPILQAWSHILQRKVNEEHGSLGPEKAEKILKAELKIKKDKLYRIMNVSALKMYSPWLQFPVWLLLIETIRKMSGAPDGLLSLLAKPFSQSIDQDRDATLAAIDSKFPVEHSFSNEGALWFSNLLVPDPQLILPFILSGILFANIYRQTQVANASGLAVSKWSKRLSNSFKVVALAIGPLTLQVPVAMLVYWISTSTIALLSNEILDKVYPHAKRVIPCKPRQPIGSLNMMPKPQADSKT